MSTRASPTSSETAARRSRKSKGNAVMVIDGDDAFRETIGKLMAASGQGKPVWSLHTIGEAMEAMAGGAVPDVVYLEMDFPDTGGLDGMSALRRICPSAEYVFVTTSDDDELVLEAVCNGAAGYLLKDDPADELMRQFQEVSAGGAALNARLTRRVLEMCVERIGPRTDYGLTEREVEILRMMVKGLTKKRMAAGLFLSYHTIDTHIKNIYQKLHVHSRAEAVVKAIRKNII